MSGKGSKRRPGDEAAYAEGWDRVFGKKRHYPLIDGSGMEPDVIPFHKLLGDLDLVEWPKLHRPSALDRVHTEIARFTMETGLKRADWPAAVLELGRKEYESVHNEAARMPGVKCIGMLTICGLIIRPVDKDSHLAIVRT